MQCKAMQYLYKNAGWTEKVTSSTKVQRDDEMLRWGFSSRHLLAWSVSLKQIEGCIELDQAQLHDRKK